jgi:histidine triad (HIT) family protein
MSTENCIFCKIVNGDVSAEKVYECDLVLGFLDANPQAPEHILIIPKQHVASLQELDVRDKEVLSAIIRAVQQIAKKRNISDGYRLVTNIGVNAGQTVAHLHFHLLGGRKLNWPPG